MSMQACVWVLEDAPDLPKHLFATLMGLANHADENGRGAYPSQETLAWYGRKDERSVRRDLDQLEEIGLISKGDQRLVLHLPADKRPVVYNLAMERKRPPRPERRKGGRPRKNEGTPTSPGNQAENRGDVDVRGDAGDKTGGTPVANRGDVHVPQTVLEPSLEPSVPTERPADDEPGGESVQPTLTGPVPEVPQQRAGEEPTPDQRAFGIARGWIDYRASRNTPVVGGRPLHQLRSLIKPFIDAGYTDDECKRALNGLNEGIPSRAQMERALVRVRQGRAVASAGRYTPPPGTLDVNSQWDQPAVGQPVGAGATW